MAGGKSVGLTVLAMMALAALADLACGQLASRALPPVPVCAAEGRFPDPTDCGFYMDCTSNGDGTYTQKISPCPEGTYYDRCQGDCSKTTKPEKCSFTCDKNDQIIIPSDNPNVYFECIWNNGVWNINVSRCPEGKAQDSAKTCSGDVVNCPVNSGSSGLPTCNGTYYYGDETNCSVFYYCSAANESAVKGFCPEEEYFVAYNHSCTEFHCTSEGVFADPANCSRYYYCASDYKKSHKECQSGTHFDSSVGGCLLGTCTNVCPGGGSNFRCPSSGFFADPLKCTWYYYCNSSLQASHFKCPDGSYFDSPIGGCMVGDCPGWLVVMGVDVGEPSLQSVSSLSVQHEEAQISFWTSRNEKLQVPTP